MRRPLVGAAVGLAVGSAIGVHGAPFPPVAHAALALALAPPLAPLAFVAAGWRAAEAAAARGRASADPRSVLTGSVATVPERTADLVRFRLRTAAGDALDVLAPPSPWPLALGDRIRLEATLREPPAARNPGGRDVRARLAASGVALQAIATAPAVRLAPPSPAALLERARERLAEAAARALPAREAGLVRAIGSGDRGGLDPETTRSFARSGLAHVLAVSGLHLVVVALGLERLLRALFLRLDGVAARVDPRRLAAALALPWALAYAVATGAGVPVLRAALAAGAALLGTLLDREGDALQALALAALVLLAADPGSALDPSLQLSFAAVAGLALWAGPLRRLVPLARAPRGTWRARLGEPLLAGACASLAATVATAPVLAFHFRQLPTLGVLANLAGVPLGSALTVLATLAGLLAALAPALALPVLAAARPLATALLALSDAAAAPAWAVLGVGTPGLAGALASYGAALAATRARGLARAAAWAGAAAALLLPADLRARAARLRGGLEVTFVSVGQGDAALLRLPDGSAVLVDAGGAAHGGADPGARDVVPLLRDLGVRRLAAVFVSHPHPDHVLGLAAIADALPIEATFSNGEPGDGASDAVLAPLAPRPLLPGDGWARAGVSFDVLGGDRAALGPNDASLVLRVRYGETVFLFPGDVEARGEAAAVLRGGLRADVVKIPHHASRTSSTRAFVEAVRPRHAVACVGAGNRHGFPHGEVLERWRGVGATVHRTDEGAVRFVSDGRTIRRVPASDALDPLAILRERA
jgi:competence protein ComEC